jgi:hypothetical protein
MRRLLAAFPLLLAMPVLATGPQSAHRATPAAEPDAPFPVVEATIPRCRAPWLTAGSPRVSHE